MRYLGLLLILALGLAACEQQQPDIMHNTNPDEIPLIPVMVHPLEAHSPGGGGREGAYEVGFELQTDWSMEELSQHYAEQLAAAGWVAISESFEEQTLVRYWEVSDENGSVWPGVLRVSPKSDAREGVYFIEVGVILPP